MTFEFQCNTHLRALDKKSSRKSQQGVTDKSFYEAALNIKSFK